MADIFDNIIPRLRGSVEFPGRLEAFGVVTIDAPVRASLVRI